MKHTPGPWIAVGAWVEHPNDAIPDICTCDPRAVFQDGRSDEEVCANATLIAAAPEMLAALKAIMRGVAGMERDHKYELARAAIAKATGGLT